MLSSSSLLLQRTRQLRHYVTRAHPKPTPVFPIIDALKEVLKGTEERLIKRAKKWERNKEERARQGKIKDDGPYRNQDETVELALNLNLDPRKPGQALRGAVSLPFGSGKIVRCVVFSSDPNICKVALEDGAKHAGGEELVDRLVSGDIPLDFDRAMASQEMSGYLTKKLARVLGPRGLMPNAKVGTLVNRPEELTKVLKDQLAGQLLYRTDKEGTVHLAVGKASFGHEKLMLNMQTVLGAIQSAKPELLGKEKKPSKNAVYFLSAYMSATQGQGIKLDLRTVDPTSAFFCTEILE